ncbi:MAG: DUF116 domain-containing protein [Candidatus Bathyarchaeota archaeon]|nr:DUF116 domain-containing protein [Candidatus Bathyarchaeota archaeon]
MNLNKNGSVMRLMKKLAKSKLSGITIGKLEQLAAKMGVDEKELLQLYVDTKNNASKKKFAATPYSERILLLPQCLRSRDCHAELEEYGYECMKCGKCGIPEITHQAKKLGYKDVFIIPGGSVATKILSKGKPKACLGVSCLKELVLGSFVCEKLGVAAQGIALLRDGCVETAVNWKKVSNVLHLNLTLLK